MILYGFFLFLTFVFGFLATRSDPTDPIIYEER